MASKASGSSSILTKRKSRTSDATVEGPKEEWGGFGGIEMASDDEEAGGSEAGDDEEDEVEAFPEIDARSDEESEESADEDEEDEGDEEESEEEDSDPQDEEEQSDRIPTVAEDVAARRLPGMYPKPKLITSEITGEPKKVYPEIEPGYDSDSSTEDVSAWNIT